MPFLERTNQSSFTVPYPTYYLKTKPSTVLFFHLTHYFSIPSILQHPFTIHYFNLLATGAGLFGTTVLAAPNPEVDGFFRPGEYYSGETAARLCYTAPNNTPQGVSVDDIKFAATYLRSYGRQKREGRLLTINVADSQNCGEWSLYTHGTVQITAKHLDMANNASILFKDIATTLDSGEKANAATAALALLGCGPDGGSLGVTINSTNPAYTSAAYKALTAVPNGVLIKVVAPQ